MVFHPKHMSFLSMMNIPVKQFPTILMKNAGQHRYVHESRRIIAIPNDTQNPIFFQLSSSPPKATPKTSTKLGSKPASSPAPANRSSNRVTPASLVKRVQSKLRTNKQTASEVLLHQGWQIPYYRLVYISL